MHPVHPGLTFFLSEHVGCTLLNQCVCVSVNIQQHMGGLVLLCVNCMLPTHHWHVLAYNGPGLAQSAYMQSCATGTSSKRCIDRLQCCYMQFFA